MNERQQEMPINDVTSITDERKEARLRDEFDLVRVKREMYELLPGAAKKKAASTERVAKFREKQAAAGLVPTAVPAALVSEVKAAGGWDSWLQAMTAPAAPSAPVAVEVVKEIVKTVEVIKTVERPLTAAEREDIAAGQRLARLTGWRRVVVRFLTS